MKRVKLYDAVNSSETLEELCEAFDKVTEVGFIRGRIRIFEADRMKAAMIGYINGDHDIPNAITREFGLRQQAMYIKYYIKLEETNIVISMIKSYDDIGRGKDKQTK